MSKIEEMRRLREAETNELLKDKQQNPHLYESDLRDNIAYDSAIYRGEISPPNDGIIVESGQAFAKGFVNSIRWVNKDYFTGILNRNQQWNAPANCSAATEFARGIGFFFGISWIAWIILFTGLLIRYRRVFSKYHKKIEKLVKSNTVSDDKKDAFYAIALEELENNQIDKITWAKAMATQGSNNDLTKSAYIKLRVEKLEKELIKEQKNILD